MSSTEYSIQYQLWSSAHDSLKIQMDSLINHKEICIHSKQTYLIPNCCADLFLSVQKAKDDMDENYATLIKLSTKDIGK